MRPNHVLRLAACLELTLSASARAAEKRPMTPEDVVSLWRVSDPQISPDGSRVAFVLTLPDTDGKPRASVWLAPGESAAPRELKTRRAVAIDGLTGAPAPQHCGLAVR